MLNKRYAEGLLASWRSQCLLVGSKGRCISLIIFSLPRKRICNHFNVVFVREFCRTLGQAKKL